MKIQLLYSMDCKYCLKIKKAIQDALKETKIVAQVEEVLIDNKDRKLSYNFEGSPTLRINGKDIQGIMSKHVCDSCSHMAGNEVKCRTYYYNGKNYNYPPKEMIKEALLKYV